MVAGDFQVVGTDIDRDRSIGDGIGGRQEHPVPQDRRPLDGPARKHVDRAEELGDERGGRVVVERLRRAHLLDLPLVEHHDLVGDLERLLLVVGHEQAGDVHLVVELAEPGAQLLADPGVERAEGLVQEQDLGPGGQRPRQGDALPLPAGELRRVAVGEPLELHQLQQLVGPRPDLAAREPPDFQAEGDVLADGHVPEQGIMLEDEAHAPALHGLVGRVLSEELHMPRVGLLQPGDDPQDRALARAGRPQQRHELARGHHEGDPIEGLEVTEAFREVFDHDAHREIPYAQA